ncbi:MAG: chromosome segregation protein SMC [Lachnospiraceae bacterium]|nr:chromosome segregation protein SMC [Lachnospiraceae bacterium]
MYLKSIEIQGFKSFANKMNFEFHNGITGIVGPNGSGKSNVADAVRWVLGEQKVKSLRGSKMEDVIFAGTENRKPLGFAYVAITLDNSDHKLDIDFDEVTVSRRLYRSGESEYMINGSQVRLKDVNELFYDTGIGKEGYSIIGQGQVERILSGKPEERRELIDEAAGIVKYKRRKNDALKKLNDQNQNLVRVEDILSELERQVGPLSRQSETAKKYLAFKDELKKNDVNMFLLELQEIRDKIAEIEEKTNISTNDLNDSQAKFEEIKQEYAKIEAVIEEINNKAEEKKNALNEANLEAERIDGRIRVLEEQIRSAKSSEEFQTSRIEALETEIDEKTDSVNTLKETKEEFENQISDITGKQNDFTSEISLCSEEISELEKEIEGYKQEVIDLINTKGQVASQMERCDALLEEINKRKATLNQKLIEFETVKSNHESIIKELENDLTQAESSLNELNESANKYKEEIVELRKKNNEIVKELEQNSINYHRNNSRLESLKNITERYDGYGTSIKKVMELKSSKKGVIGVVADIIKVDKKYEVAIETALGGSIQNIVTDTETTAKEIIEYLKKNKFGRATFLPLSSLSNKVSFNNVNALDEKGAIGIASELVDIKQEYSGVAKFLLGRILVVDNIDNALFIARKYRYSMRIVTLEGENLSAGGAISGGAFKNSSNLLGRRREIEEIEKSIKELYDIKKNLDSELLKVRGEMSVAGDELEKLNQAIKEQEIFKSTAEVKFKQAVSRKNDIVNEYKEVTVESQDISGQIANINKNSARLTEELSGWEDRSKELEEIIDKKNTELIAKKAELEEKSEELEGVKLELVATTQKHSNIVENIKRVEMEIESTKEELLSIKDSSSEAGAEINAKVDAIEKLREEKDNNANGIVNLEKEIKDLEEESKNQTKDHKEFFEKREELSDRINQLDKDLYRLNSQHEQLDEKKDAKVNYMWNEYEITFSDAMKLKDDEFSDKNEMRNTIARLKRDIKALGDVNVNAIDEFKEINERYTFMKEQHEDIIKAKDNLMNIINELEVGMRKQFTEKFAEIQAEFDKVFAELFGGGHGKIELIPTESGDVLDAGINIISQPPGKKLQNMMQLSGGEKALTAISLLFAIQNLKPSPFCLLDEIEAALDGSNVVRFAQYLHKLTKTTQFIVITHRRGTMGCADRLFGITMQEKGVSALVSVDLLEGDLDK